MTEQTPFDVLKKAVSLQMDKMLKHSVYVSKADKNDLWDTYLNSFPAGTNPMFRERTEFDCNCCKQFVRAAGNMLAIVNGKLVSVWDVQVGGRFQPVVEAMSAMVKAKGIADIYLTDTRHVGTDRSFEADTDLEWGHFHHVLPASLVNLRSSIPTIKGKARTNNQVLFRSLEEITSSSMEVVIELIEQNSLYRGTEHLSAVKGFLILKQEFEASNSKELYVWKKSQGVGPAVCSIRNSVIGTLLVDISEGVDLEVAVGKYEAKVAPHNYKRPTALVTQRMVDQANKTVQDLDIEDSLYRRFAITEDIHIDNLLFANRAIKETAGVFDVMRNEVSSGKKSPKLDKVEDVSIDDFLNNILPKADSIEMYLENEHLNNLVSLVAPVHLDSTKIMKWENNFSWTYNGEVTDSVKERVKSAGGSVTGDLRLSLAWSNSDDLDLSVIEPKLNGFNRAFEIYFGDKRSSKTGGQLDVDMNAGAINSKDPVENITWPNKSKMTEGIYSVRVKNYSRRGSSNVGFIVEFEFAGKIITYNHPKGLRDTERVEVVRFKYTHADGVKILNAIESTMQDKEIWGITTNKFHKVDMAMLSPNMWTGSGSGNKHVFFMLENCLNPDKARGFYNEFLRDDLRDHRKVFEILGSKLKAEHTDNQLSGLGFSTTQRNTVKCRVRGAFNRIVNIKF